MPDERIGCRFVTRFPETYSEGIQAVKCPVAADAWDDIGVLSSGPPTNNPVQSHYLAILQLSPVVFLDPAAGFVHERVVSANSEPSE